MSRGTFLAPAKLNLFLHVLGRRDDGYHSLQTVFQLIDLCDRIELEATEDPAIRRDPLPSDPGLAALAPEADLSVRAARLLQQASGCRQGARLHVEKHIPTGGGLGGGSSDAATVMLGLNALWSLQWPRERLAELGLALGADVPVFVMGRNAWAEGRGEQLTPIQLPAAWYVVVQPAVAVSTATVFQDPELTRNTPPLTMRDFRAGAGRNDCEPVVRRRYRPVAAALDWLSGFAPARLTGTGGCGFAAFGDETRAREVAAQAPSGIAAYVARGLDRSPV